MSDGVLVREMLPIADNIKAKNMPKATMPPTKLMMKAYRTLLKMPGSL